MTQNVEDLVVSACDEETVARVEAIVFIQSGRDVTELESSVGDH